MIEIAVDRRARHRAGPRPARRACAGAWAPPAPWTTWRWPRATCCSATTTDAAGIEIPVFPVPGALHGRLRLRDHRRRLRRHSRRPAAAAMVGATGARRSGADAGRAAKAHGAPAAPTSASPAASTCRRCWVRAARSCAVRSAASRAVRCAAATGCAPAQQPRRRARTGFGLSPPALDLPLMRRTICRPSGCCRPPNTSLTPKLAHQRSGTTPGSHAAERPLRLPPRRNAAACPSRRSRLRSHGIVPGVIQVPQSGQPIIQMRDAQPSGGYPKIGTVIEADLWRLGQAPIGSRIRFVETAWDEAVAAHEQNRRWLDRGAPPGRTSTAAGRGAAEMRLRPARAI